MTDETKNPDVDTVDAAEDRIGEALEKFGNEAEAALTEIRGVARSLKESLTKEVLARAVEQSKVMQGYEDTVDAAHKSILGLQALSGEHSSTLGKLGAEAKDITRRMGEMGEAVKRVLATCKEIDDRAGEKFGAKLEAMASQVAPLAAMGMRHVAVEASNKALREKVAAQENTALGLRADSERAVIDLANLRDTFNEAAKPKAAPKAEAKAS